MREKLCHSDYLISQVDSFSVFSAFSFTSSLWHALGSNVSYAAANHFRTKLSPVAREWFIQLTHIEFVVRTVSAVVAV